ncbi:Triosephosphate isomerase [BD1-7 clade bacterium]|uniref:Triosephosphate isomerase n=1 Tax=BD1-7 clade bacterium TaxID=2029982 RepID=A0A5S9MRY4_9GAMM|nr:Triosephosphate isomerase [BD1-7 clade bacterium]
MRRKLIIGNWKMNGSPQSVTALAEDLSSGVSNLVLGSVDAVVCPPSVYTAVVVELLAGTSIQVGAQNVCAEALESGAYTGEVSAQMFAQLGCKFGLVGHSERREYYGESDVVVAAKCAHLLAQSITPVLCVGESLAQRDAGDALDVVSGQVAAIIDVIGIAQFLSVVVAYEPVWAIGTGRTASPQQAQEVHAAIRQCVAGYDSVTAERIQILYGGSVKGANAAELFAMEDIDGALVGGAALDAEEFCVICKSAE